MHMYVFICKGGEVALCVDTRRILRFMILEALCLATPVQSPYM